MPEQRVLQLEYQQSLSYSSTRPAWSEEVTISVRILSEAITSGWYAENFGKRALDFVVLIALVMHSRPLTGADLALFIQLGLATKSDEGRLYARVTDKGLARELHVDRDTVGACATRLHKHQFITIAQLPEGMDFHDSRGQYAGSKIYLVSGELQNLLQKGISHRAEIFPTVTSFSADRAETFRTADNNPSPHRAENNRIGAENLRINIDDDDSADGEVNGSAAEIPISNIVFMHFSSRKGVTDYNPTNNERDALDGLLKEGFTLEQILGAIDAAFARPSKPRYFTLCANIAHDIARNAARNLPPEARTLGTCQSEANPPETRQPEACQKPENIESELTRAAEIYCSGSRALTQDVVARLRRMAQRCESTAQQAGATGGEWLADAMELALGNAQPESLLNYADTVLKGWSRTGRGEPKSRTPDTDNEQTPELEIFRNTTGGRLPLRDQRAIVTRIIRENSFTEDDLRPFWEVHVIRDKKRSDLTWLMEWAVKGEIPIGGKPGRKSGLDQMADTLLRLSQRED